MNKETFLRALAAELRRLPKEEYDRAMAYYVEYFEEAGSENEADVIADLGTPKEVAAELIADTAMKRMADPEKIVKRPFSSIWTVILAIFAAPIALPLAFSLVLVVVFMMLAMLMLVAAVLLTEVALGATGFISVIIGFILLFSQPATGIVNLGSGLLVIGLAILFSFLVVRMMKWCSRGVRSLFGRIIRKGRKS